MFKTANFPFDVENVHEAVKRLFKLPRLFPQDFHGVYPGEDRAVSKLAGRNEVLIGSEYKVEKVESVSGLSDVSFCPGSKPVKRVDRESGKPSSEDLVEEESKSLPSNGWWLYHVTRRCLEWGWWRPSLLRLCPFTTHSKWREYHFYRRQRRHHPSQQRCLRPNTLKGSIMDVPATLKGLPFEA